MSDDLVQQLHNDHPIQYWIDPYEHRDSEKYLVLGTENMESPPGHRVERFNRCPKCEQWSPCDARLAADRIEALEAALSIYADPEKWKVEHQGMGNHFRAIDAVQDAVAREALDA